LELKQHREETQAVQHHKLKQELKKETEWMRKAPRARETKSVKREKEFYDLEEQFENSKGLQRKRKSVMEFDLMKRRV
jgi:ATPase subunit of ABC transporter with duplicated ATPase domains